MVPVSPENLPHILEFEWRRLAFFERVPLEDLAILHPSAAEYRTKEEFLAEDVERLRHLSVLAVKQCPAEVEALQSKDCSRSLLNKDGGRTGDRTRDLLNVSQALSR